LKSPKETEGESSPKPIFFDPTAHRLVFFTVFSVVFLVFALVWFVLFIVHLYGSELPRHVATPTPEIVESGSLAFPRYPLDQQDRPTTYAPTAPVSDGQARKSGGDQQQNGEFAPQPASRDTIVHAFVPYWSMAGLVETRTNISLVDVLLPEWFSIDRMTGEITSFPGTQRDKLRDIWFQNRDRVKLLPVARANFNEGNEPAQWLTSPEIRADLIMAVSSLVQEEKFDGLCLDFAGARAQDVEAIANFAVAAKGQLDQVGKEFCIIAAMDDALLNLPKAADLSGRLIVLAFREPGPFSGPSPLAPQDWYEDRLAELQSRIPAVKLVIALGDFGMDWISGRPVPEYSNYFDITEAVARHGGSIEFDPESLNSVASFSDAEGRRHQIWFLDALSAHNQLAQIPFDQIGGVAIWPVSGGDPGVWELLSPGLPTLNDLPGLLQDIKPASHVRYTGMGPLLKVENPAAPGRRVLTADPESGLISYVNYLEYPRAYTVNLSGTLPDNSVILTFDDGPSRTYTPQILDILSDYGVPAVFFVVGTRVQNSPDIIRRIVEDGHELGVHTYSHPNISEISDLRLKLELHASQELIKSVSGLNTNLFRAPYGFDENPETPDEAKVLTLLSNERYVVVGIEIDSTDWTRPGIDRIVETVTSLVQANRGNVILFHDAGGDRGQTVLALPRIIEALGEMGVSIVPLSSITGQGSAPVSSDALQDGSPVSDYSFWLIRALKSAVTAIFFFMIAAGIIRSLAVLVLALIKERRVHESSETSMPVTVLIPAYCEETVITKSVRSVLQSTYPVEQIIVVDDGSTDETAKVVTDNFGSDRRVRLVRQNNQGKAEALNNGIGLIGTPVFVAIDADTIISPEAIGLLVRHFNDKTVGAVAGNVKVGNRRNLLTRLQAIEYITAQNLDRRAFEVLNGIMVVSGSIGAWRTEAVKNAGGYTTQTIVEDADLTVSIIRNGHKIVYEPKAHAFTEAPESISQWMKQRLRWHFGMLQIAWKHKSAFFERRAVGIVSIPDLVLFGAVFSLFAPIADIVMAANLVSLAGHLTGASPLSWEDTSVLVAIAYVAYLLSDLVLATIAFGLEPEEDKRLLPWVLTQRFFYRQIYWMVALRSIARVVTGRFTGWRKITRMSSIDPASTLGLSRYDGRTVTTDKIALRERNQA
jgi:cellulose synthase/poly-beta-1,6-N-acetylglucosamine synthase-like glycosyltransferase/peptidoglycan/xylan/chitin deacetylase (PgdA/CDA1 family)